MTVKGLSIALSRISSRLSFIQKLPRVFKKAEVVKPISTQPKVKKTTIPLPIGILAKTQPKVKALLPSKPPVSKPEIKPGVQEASGQASAERAVIKIKHLPLITPNFEGIAREFARIANVKFLGYAVRKGLVTSEITVYFKGSPLIPLAVIFPALLKAILALGGFILSIAIFKGAQAIQTQASTKAQIIEMVKKGEITPEQGKALLEEASKPNAPATTGLSAVATEIAKPILPIAGIAIGALILMEVLRRRK